jgi:hypothetical protein
MAVPVFWARALAQIIKIKPMLVIRFRMMIKVALRLQYSTLHMVEIFNNLQAMT